MLFAVTCMRVGDSRRLHIGWRESYTPTDHSLKGVWRYL